MSSSFQCYLVSFLEHLGTVLVFSCKYQFCCHIWFLRGNEQPRAHHFIYRSGIVFFPMCQWRVPKLNCISLLDESDLWSWFSFYISHIDSSIFNSRALPSIALTFNIALFCIMHSLALYVQYMLCLNHFCCAREKYATVSNAHLTLSIIYSLKTLLLMAQYKMNSNNLITPPATVEKKIQ